MNDCTTAWPRIWSLPKRRTLRVLLYIGHCPEACVAQDMVDVRLQPLHLLFSNATILLNMVFLQFSTMLYHFNFHHFHNDFIFLIFFHTFPPYSHHGCWVFPIFGKNCHDLSRFFFSIFRSFPKFFTTFFCPPFGPERTTLHLWRRLVTAELGQAPGGAAQRVGRGEAAAAKSFA